MTPTWTCENDPEPERWFPIGAAAEAVAIDELKPICQACPAIEACLAFALVTKAAGIWAGTTEDERRAMPRRAARAATRPSRAKETTA